MNYVGLLQEHCQKQGRPAPHYAAQRVGGPDHHPSFSCVVRVSGNGCYRGSGASIKEAKSEAARAALAQLAAELIQRGPASAKPKLWADVPTALLIDLDNLPNAIVEVDRYQTNLEVMGAVSRAHALASNGDPRIVVTPSTRKDACDVEIILLVAELANRFTRIVVMTKDHFGGTLAEVASSRYGIQVLHAMNMKELRAIVESRQRATGQDLPRDVEPDAPDGARVAVREPAAVTGGISQEV